MGTTTSKPSIQVQESPRASNSGRDPQVCVRKPCQETCPFHPGCTVTTLCGKCMLLVCVECVITDGHKGHTLTMLSKCLHKPINTIENHTKCIEELILFIQREAVVLKHDLENNQQKREFQIGKLKNSKLEGSFKTERINQYEEYYDVLEKTLKNYETLIKTSETQLSKKLAKYVGILKSGSDVSKYDTGILLNKVAFDKVPDKPCIPELTDDMDFGEVMIRLRREMHRVSELRLTDQSSEDIYLVVTSTFDNPGYYSITPYFNDKAWVGKKNVYESTNKLCLLTNKGTIEHETETDGVFVSLCIHPTTKQLYGGFEDNTVKSIENVSGTTIIVAKCECLPESIKVTSDNNVLVGTTSGYNVSRYNLKGGSVQESSESFKVHNIDHCLTSNRVLLSCGYDGIVILNNKLLRIYKFTGLSGQGRKVFECRSAIFYEGNIIVSDFSNKEIFIIEGEHFRLIRNLHINGLTYPMEIKLSQKVLWVRCLQPQTIMCILMV